MSADLPLTTHELATIKHMAEGRVITISVARETMLRLVAEIERLREERAAVDLMDWPREAHRLQAALHFAKGTINDMAETIERLEADTE